MADDPRPAPGRKLTSDERERLLELDIPARFASLDQDGFPRIVPIWFIWRDGAFYMTSVPGRRHLADLERDSRAAICVDTEGTSDAAGARPNRQVNARGYVELFDDPGGEWTRRITLKYVPGEVGQVRAKFRAAMPRVVMRLVPERLLSIGTGG